MIANEPSVRCRENYDPNVDPPPDLAIEAPLRPSHIDRTPVYAALRVPEIWRYENESVYFHRLNEFGRYDCVERGIAFPTVTSAGVKRHLDQLGSIDENSILRSLIESVREQAGPADGAGNPT